MSNQLVPQQLFIETTNVCNSDCVFCAYRYDKRKKVVLGGEDFRGIVEEYKELGGEIINFTPYAGEVFSDRDFLEKVNIAHEIGFKELNTYSNVTIIDKFGIDNILQSGLTSLAVSTAPLEEKTYKAVFQTRLYSKMLKNLVELIKRFHEIDFTTVKTIRIEFRSDRALDEIKKMPDYKKIEPFVYDGVVVSCLQSFDTWMGMISPDELLPGMKIKSADFDKPMACDRLYMLKVTSNGKIRACGCRYDYSKEVDDFYLGNTEEISLIDAYNSGKLQQLKSSFVNGNPPEACAKCSWYESFRYHGE